MTNGPTTTTTTADDKLRARLLHAIDMERKAGARVKRAATLLHKWSAARRRLTKRIGDAEVLRIVEAREAATLARKRQKQTARVVSRLQGDKA